MKLNINSLTIKLSFIVSVCVALVAVTLVVTSYNVAYNAIEYAYMNQVKNFNSSIERNFIDKYERETQNAKFFANSPMVIEATKSGNFAAVKPWIAFYFKEKGAYEQLFISTVETNSKIIMSADGKADGLRWGTIPEYVNNVKETLNGNVAYSDVGLSPVNGKNIILITVPIKSMNQVVGVFGMSLYVDQFAQKMVNDVKIGKTGYPFITNFTGKAFAHPDKKVVNKLKVGDYEWGIKMLKGKSGETIFYNWQGKDKFLTFIRNEKYKFYVATTMFMSDINDDARTMAIIMIVSGLVLISCAAIGIYFYLKNRLNPLNECKAVMSEMADGNLTARYKGVLRTDEIGDIAKFINNVMEKLEKVIAEIILAAENLSQAVEQIASGNENLSQRTSEQASSIEEIASTIEQAAATINQNADNAERAKNLTTVGASKSMDGNKVAIEAVASIIEMNDSSKKISEIISVINEIAFQTNLLALNAAVEAARAGEHGRGFAVVAGEVRNLAQRAAGAAKQIEDLINDAVSKVDASTELVNKTGNALTEIAEAAKTSVQIITEIAEANREQQQGMNQINNAITEMDTMTQQNASLVEETASASEEMSNQATELSEMMKRFKINGTFQGREKSNVSVKKLDVASKTIKGKGKENKKETQQSDEELHLHKILKAEGFEEF